MTDAARRVLARFLIARARDLYPDMDPRLAALFETATDLSKDAHAKFQNAKAGIGAPTSDDWREIVRLYARAIKAWNSVMAHPQDYIFHFQEGGTNKVEDKDRRAMRIRRICVDRQKEAEALQEKAFRRERDEEEAWENSL